MVLDKKKIVNGAIAIVIGSGLFGYGYLLGRGYFLKWTMKVPWMQQLT